MNTLSSLLYFIGTKIANSRITGEIKAYAGSTIPSGWLACNGSAVSRETYADLFAVIGTTYGAGDGSTTFNLPDLRGRVPLGIGDGTASNHTNHTLGQAGGDENAIIVSHRHSVNSFNIPIVSGSNNSGSGNKDLYYSSGSYTKYLTAPAHNTNYSGSSATGANMMPYLGINYIIFAGV